MLLRTSKDVGAIVRQRRRDLHLDQRTLAERVGVSRQWISECERGKPRAELALVLRTLAVLGVRLSVGEDPPVAGGRQREKGETGASVDVPDIDAIVRNARKPSA